MQLLLLLICTFFDNFFSDGKYWKLLEILWGKARSSKIRSIPDCGLVWKAKYECGKLKILDYCIVRLSNRLYNEHIYHYFLIREMHVHVLNLALETMDLWLILAAGGRGLWLDGEIISVIWYRWGCLLENLNWTTK